MTELTDDATHDEIAAMNERLVLINRIIRHDVRNDMATAHGWAEELRGHVDEDGEDVLERVLDAVQRTLDLTKASRDFVRAAMTGTSVHLEPVPLRHAVAREVDRLEAIESQVDVTADGVPDVDVLADDLLSSVFANVLENAVTHNDNETPVVDVTAARDGDTVTVRVSDDGPGVAEEDRDAVFGRAERGIEDPAAGLGLHLVDGLVNGYDGSVRIESNEPRGAVVAIELRVSPEEIADDEGEGDAAPPPERGEGR